MLSPRQPSLPEATQIAAASGKSPTSRLSWSKWGHSGEHQSQSDQASTNATAPTTRTLLQGGTWVVQRWLYLSSGLQVQGQL